MNRFGTLFLMFLAFTTGLVFTYSCNGGSSVSAGGDADTLQGYQASDFSLVSHQHVGIAANADSISDLQGAVADLQYTVSELQAVISNLGGECGMVAFYPFTGSAMDFSCGDNDGTVVGAVLTQDRLDRVDRAYYFDGANDYITVPNSPDFVFSDKLTVSAWVWIEQFPTGANMQVVQKNDPAGAVSNHTFSLPILGSPGSYYGGCCSPYTFGLEMNLNGTMRSGMWSSAALTTQTWYHLAATYDGSEVRLYLDGALDSSYAASGSIAQNLSSVGIGGYHLSSIDFFSGVIDDVRIYDRALDEAEIQGVYDRCN